MTHHDLDLYPDLKEKSPLYINEPWLVDKTLLEFPIGSKPDETDDNVRVFIPMDLNKDAILRRLEEIIARYGEANEENEINFSTDVDLLIFQIEIYDQIWYVRHMPEEGRHSSEAISLVRDFVSRLEGIPDGCAECFPFETIDELKKEYLSKG